VYAVSASNGSLVWRTVLACAGGCEGVHGSVGVADAVVLVPVNHGDVFGLNAGTHATLWAPLGYAFAAAGGVAYINDAYDGLVRAVQLKTGNELWDVICGHAGAPAYANGLLYVGCDGGSAGRELVAIDVTAGAGKEAYPLNVDLGPTVSGGTVYFTGRTNQPELHLYAVGV
jgi:outer membrane protein assembly factor BamB